ncbi:MAG: pitrilysin family protein [Candidatus Eisenbacteria bacterium]|nr:pitrilysin family protein [Candidatus Eisenbacteria bacterium]
MRGERASSVFSKEIFPGGITVVAEKIPAVRSLAIGVWVKNGSRDESRSQNGISHFIEHMVFKGTKRKNAYEIAHSLESIGGNLDAFTAREFTCYYARVLDEYLEQAIDVLSDIVCDSLFEKASVDREKQVVTEEIMSYEDTPDELVHDLFADTIWSDHPLGGSILGSRESVDSFTSETVRGYFEERYGPERIVISLAGSFDCEAALKAIEKSFHFPGNGKERATVPPGAFDPRVRNFNRDLSQQYICFGTRGIPFTHPDRMSLLLLTTMVGGGMSSRLFQSVREREGLAYSVFSYADFYRDTGLFGCFIGANPKQGKNALRCAMKELDELKKGGMKKSELDSAKAQLKGNLLMGLESMSNRMTRLAKSELYYGRNVTPDELVSSIEQVKEEEVLRVANGILNPEEFSLVVLGPIEPGEYSASDLTV